MHDEARARECLAAEYERDAVEHDANGYTNAAATQRARAQDIRDGKAELHAIRAMLAFNAPPDGNSLCDEARELAQQMASRECIYGDEDGPDWCGNCHGCRQQKASSIIARLIPFARLSPHQGDREAIARETIRDALMDSQYLAGAKAGWNAAQADDPEASYAKLKAGREGHMAGYRVAKEALLQALLQAPPPTDEEWQTVDTAPSACHVIGARFEPTDGEWIYAVVSSPPSKPFTHWRALPTPPATPQIGPSE